MVLRWVLLSALFVAGFALPEKRTYDTHSYYVLHYDPLAPSGAPLADVLRTLDVELVEQAGELLDHWLVRRRKPHYAARDSWDPVISAYETLKAQAASPLTGRSEDTHLARRLVSSVDYLSLQTLRQRVKRAPPPISPPPVRAEPASKFVAEHFGIKDPLFGKQWHLINDQHPEHMMNVTGVWDMGYTGKGIISSFIDDGLEYEHEDLAANFDADDSYDYNDHEPLPTPKNFDDHHGTRCAGQVAALKNKVCGIGLAYESKVAGVRILSGPISDVDEAAALNYGFQNVSIYSCSWGPPDNGKSMEGPNYLIKKALVNGINNGRGGKGSIFVFASGNGAASGDQCNFDGYTNSIYSVTVSAIDFKGLHPYYSEPCAANMVVAYSSGSGQHIVTTDKGMGNCATSHGGTSAAAPNAVGILALALQARPDLTWRDVQYLCIKTATMVNPDDPDWEKIASGKKYSYKYGFGAIDGFNYVKAAKTWNLVTPQTWYQTKTIQLNNGTFGSDRKYLGGEFIPAGGIESKMVITKDALNNNNFQTLEHITIKVWIQHARRGDVEVEIVSPNGFKSVLGGARQADDDKDGYPGWTFMSVKHWGENPVGSWTLKVKDQNKPGSNGTFLGWNMVLWGASIDATQVKKYEVPLVDDVLPPVEAPSRPIILPTETSTTKQHPKPTAHLPGDHGIASGENTKPAFTASPTELLAEPTSSLPAFSGTPDIGWLPGLGALVTSQKWFFVALGAVSIFGIAAGVFFWRRRVAQMANYTSLSNGENEVTMAALGTSMSGPRTTRELYDAFGEVSDDDDDETTALRPPLAKSIGFHSGFLEDDEPPTPSAGLATGGYRDELGPEEGHREGHGSGPVRDREETASSGSGDGSWDHASRD